MENQPNQSLIKAMSLNDILDQIEKNLGKLGEGMGVDPKEILAEMDEANLRLKSAASQDHPSISEEAQFEYIGKSLQKYAGLFLRILGGLEH